jgi:hypothetical protein
MSAFFNYSPLVWLSKAYPSQGVTIRKDLTHEVFFTKLLLNDYSSNLRLSANERHDVLLYVYVHADVPLVETVVSKL